MKYILFASFVFLGFTTYTQPVTAKIVDADSKSPIHYANIGVIGKNQGTISDENGLFTLMLPEGFDKDTLRVSTIGFNPITYKVEDFKRIFRQSKGGLVIELTRKTTILSELFVVPKQFKEKKLGSRGRLGRIDFECAKDTTLGSEIGTVIKVKHAKGFIQNLNVVFRSSYDSLLFRINIYSMQKELPAENILKEPVYVSTSVQKGIITVNLEKYNVFVDDDFFASVEWIQKMPMKIVGFGAGFKGQSFMRVTSQGTWDKVPLGLGVGIFATIIYAK